MRCKFSKFSKNGGVQQKKKNHSKVFFMDLHTQEHLP